MIAFSRWHVVIVAAIILFLSLAQIAHHNSYDADVLRYVSNTIKKEGSDSNKAAEYIKSAVPTPVEHYVTITHTVTGPTVTETQVVKEVADDSDCGEKNALWVEPFPVFNTTIEVPAKMTFDPKGPRADQIVLLTATDGKGHNEAIEGVVEMATSNRDIYAKHHGYIHHFINITKYDTRDINPVWKKLPAIVETFNTFPEAQWVFWLDLDAIIMTPQVDLQSLILSKDGMRKNFHLGAKLMESAEKTQEMYWPNEPDWENVDFIVAQDGATLNAGSFLLRRSHFTQWLLDIWADPFLMYASFENKEQDAMVHLMKHHPTVRKHTGIARQRSINAFMEGPPWMQWVQGDLLIHFAGCWVYGACAERWEKLWKIRGHLPDEDSLVGSHVPKE